MDSSPESGHFKEVWERELTEHRNDEIRYQLIIDTLPQGIFLKDRDSRYLSCNLQYLNMLQQGKGNIVGKTDFEIGTADWARRYREEDLQVLRTGETLDYEDQAETPNGLHWFHVIKKRVKNPQGDILGVIGIVEEITLKKAAEQVLETSRQQLENLVAVRTNELRTGQEKARALFKAVPVPTYIWEHRDDQFVLVDYNDAAVEFSQGMIEAMLGRSAAELFPEEDQRNLHVRLATVFNEKGSFAEVADYRFRASGETKTLSVKFVFVAPNQIILHMEDITALKQAEKALIDAKSQAESAARLKTEFLSNMSHEIRTPMNAVLGLTYLLRETRLDVRQSEYVQKLEASGRVLLNILTDVLDFSKIEAGKMSLERIPVDLRTVFQDSLDLIDIEASQRGLTFHMDFDPVLPTRVWGDPTRLVQIFLNLTNNAVKFTEKGRVTVKLALEKDSYSLEVEDTGIGMTGEQISKLFQPFTQADGTTTRRFGGSGLGVSITKSLVELMGGNISISSVFGEGSVFKVTLPLVVVENGSPEKEGPAIGTRNFPAASRLWKGKRILLVEDNPINQLIAWEILKKRAVKVVKSENGRQACELLARDPNFSAVLLDIQMPEMDGYEASRKIRHDLLLKDLPLIAMTAHATEEDRKKCLDAGMNDYLAKPFAPEKLWAVLELWLFH